MIGVIVPEINHLFCQRILTELRRQLQIEGYTFLLYESHKDKIRESEAVRFFEKKGVDAIINVPVDETGGHLLAFLKEEKPVILLDREIREIDCDSVCSDNWSAFYQAVGYLEERGHTKIGLIVGEQDTQAARERMHGYIAGCKRWHTRLAPSLVYTGMCTIESGIQGIRYLLKENPQMTAVIVGNHNMTVGTMIGLGEQKIKVPETLSVIGFDNRPFAMSCTPCLTIMEQSPQKIAAKLAEILRMRLQGSRDSPNLRIRQEIRLREGDSVQERI